MGFQNTSFIAAVYVNHDDVTTWKCAAAAEAITKYG